MVLANFKSGSRSFYRWQEVNDPVMGGQSYGNFSVSDGVATFQGQTRIVPSLRAPGFCKANTGVGILEDASAYTNGAIQLIVRTTTPSYKGYKFAFSAIGAKRHHDGHELLGSYKSDFTVPAGSDWQKVTIPMSHFSSDWSDFTGECSTKDPDGYQHKCCTEQSPDVCPNKNTLAKIVGFSIWAEGVAGDFKLEMKEILAVSN